MESNSKITISTEVKKGNTPNCFVSFRPSPAGGGGHRTLAMHSGNVVPKESRDEAISHGWDASRQTAHSQYERIYAPQYISHSQYDPRHRQVNHHWNPQHPRWQRRVHHHHHHHHGSVLAGGSTTMPRSSTVDIRAAPRGKAPGGMVPLSPRDNQRTTYPKPYSYGTSSNGASASAYPIRLVGPSRTAFAAHRNTAPNRNDGFHNAHRQQQHHSSSVVIIPPDLIIPREMTKSPVDLVNATSSAVNRSNSTSNQRIAIHGHQQHPSSSSSVVIIPSNLVIPREITQSPIDRVNTSAMNEDRFKVKRSSDSSDGSSSSTRHHPTKRSKMFSENQLPPSSSRFAHHHLPNSSSSSGAGKFDKLDLLCAATLDLGPLQDNPTGCSCPKSKCIALYCDCFKAGRRCDPNTCSCLNCKNTDEESGPNGARSNAIQAILARNPRAFTNAGNANGQQKLPPGEACNCIRSRCLKLYCTCFQAGKVCTDACSCVGCLNIEDDQTGQRALAIEIILEKRPDAFEKPKPKEIGSGCACKNNRCIRKYCECFRTGLFCTSKCCCRDCANQGDNNSSSSQGLSTSKTTTTTTTSTTTTSLKKAVNVASL